MQLQPLVASISEVALTKRGSFGHDIETLLPALVYISASSGTQIGGAREQEREAADLIVVWLDAGVDLRRVRFAKRGPKRWARLFARRSPTFAATSGGIGRDLGHDLRAAAALICPGAVHF